MKSTVGSDARRKVSWDMANKSAVTLGVQKLFLNSRQVAGVSAGDLLIDRRLLMGFISGVQDSFCHCLFPRPKALLFSRDAIFQKQNAAASLEQPIPIFHLVLNG